MAIILILPELLQLMHRYDMHFPGPSAEGFENQHSEGYRATPDFSVNAMLCYYDILRKRFVFMLVVRRRGGNEPANKGRMDFLLCDGPLQ